MQPMVIGVQAVKEVLTHAPQKAVALYTEKRQGPLLVLAEKRKVPIHFTPLHQLTKLAGTDSHQSFLLQVKERHYQSVENFCETAKERSLVLMLDSVFDPQNFGALLRSAECFGADGVVWSKNRGTDLTPAACKAAAGASELLPLIRVANLAEAVSRFQENGFEVVATAPPATKQGERGGEDLFTFSFSPRTVLVLGSEGEGVQPLILKRADRLVYIPMSGKVSSLNVSAAASILLAFFRNWYTQMN